MNDSSTRGLPYLGSIPGSPADKAGLQKGDEILAINGQAISTMTDAVDALSQRCNPLVVDLIRGGQYMEIKVALSEEPTPTSPGAIVMQLQQANILPHSEESKD